MLGKLKRLCRFRTKHLLLLFATFATVLGYLRWQSNRVERLATAVADAGGFIRYDYMLDEFGEPLDVTENPASTPVRLLFGDFAFVQPKHIVLSNTSTTDKTVERISNCPAIGSVTYLELEGTDVSDMCIRRLTNFAGLEGLYLDNTRILGRNLAQLSEIDTLRELHLNDTRLAIQAVEEIKMLKQLRVLLVIRCGLSDAHISSLRDSLPDCAVENDFQNFQF